MSPTHYSLIASPVGHLLLLAADDALLEIRFMGKRKSFEKEETWREGGAFLRKAEKQLREYFAGKRKRFELRLAPQGTEFQQRVWQQLTKIPFGETISYGELARRIKKPTASRAVGAANGKNPISIIIPCHRVIGQNGSLTGFGGGLPVKERLLLHEDAWPKTKHASPGLFG